MPHPLSRLAAASAAAALAVSALAQPVLAQPTSTLATSTRAASTLATSTRAASPSASTILVTLTGDRVQATRDRDGLTTGLVLPSAHRGATAGSLMSVTVGTSSYEFPAAALPYLNRGLSPDLFQLSALAREEHGGRLPVRISYRGTRPPALPGVTVTRASRGTAAGYLTQASAVSFGLALGRQDRADQAAAGRGRDTFGTDGLFARGTSISLAGYPARTSQPSSGTPKEKLTVRGTDLAGKPDFGDVVLVANADNSSIFGQNMSVSVGHFFRGVYVFNVPAGPYWALGAFGDTATSTQQYVSRLVMLPQFSVTKATTVHIAAQAATNKITMATPRPATPVSTDFSFIRTGQAGPPMNLFFSNSQLFPTAKQKPLPPMWVSPTSQRPTVGSLLDYAGQELTSPPGPGTPYYYGLEYQNQGTIPGKPYVVQPKDVATVSDGYYNAVSGRGEIAVYGSLLDNFPVGYVNPNPVFTSVPRLVTTYLGGNVPDMTWNGYYWGLDAKGNSVAGGVSLFVPYRPGGHFTDDWNAYPLHPGVNDNPEPLGWANGLQPSASRIGNTLLLNVIPSDDNQPGHLGIGFTTVDSDKVTGSYVIDQNGKKIAGGTAPPEQGGSDEFSTKATLSPAASVVSFGLNVASTGPDYQLSTATHTVWTWHSSRQPSVKLPGDWYCESTVSGFIDKCVVQPMMTLRYAVAGMARSGQVPAGREVVNLTVGHLQLVKPIAVTQATMSVSFDGGKTWHQATVTGSDGHYQAVFDAPAGAYVMTRTTAKDAAGGSVTETITRAFSVRS